MGYKEPTHGLGFHRLYKTWWSMVNRCTNPDYTEFYLYGGRGIEVCNDWLISPEKFIAWAEKAGAKKGLQIDRIDNNAGYYPGNCRFVTKSVNAINRRIRSDNSSGYVGVNYKKSDGSYVARISDKRLFKERIFIGNYKTVEEAVKARNEFIILHNMPHKIQEIA